MRIYPVNNYQLQSNFNNCKPAGGQMLHKIHQTIPSKDTVKFKGKLAPNGFRATKVYAGLLGAMGVAVTAIVEALPQISWILTVGAAFAGAGAISGLITDIRIASNNEKTEDKGNDENKKAKTI